MPSQTLPFPRHVPPTSTPNTSTPTTPRPQSISFEDTQFEVWRLCFFIAGLPIIW